jgi:MoaA/NifB/PqqE/SkfB family radical SAM enzyme
VEELQTRGLKAIILTGGGEPTAYPEFNRLVQWAKYERGLSVALITNGTLGKRVEGKTWSAFSWVRVSVNFFDGWEQRIGADIPVDLIQKAGGVVGCSMVYTSEHEATKDSVNDKVEMLKRVATIADRLGAKYVRVLPNCLLEQRALLIQHRAVDHDLERLGDARFFHQHKIHGAPKCNTCHQAYFRPYLSEEKFHGNNQPGTVYPCDSVVLNDSFQYFAKQYQICHASQVLDFMDGKIKMQFDPEKHCSGCVFTSNVDMLDKWKSDGQSRFNIYPEPLVHEEFV